MRTRTLLGYAAKLTDVPNMIDTDDLGRLRDAGWSESAIWEITGLVAFFNFSGRLEAASGLPPDEIPESARFGEARNG